MTTGLLTKKRRENELNCFFGGPIQNFKYGYMKPENGLDGSIDVKKMDKRK
jgi:hypothetical protein